MFRIVCGGRRGDEENEDEERGEERKVFIKWVVRDA